MSETVSQSCIKTRVKVPAPTILRVLQGIFPELAGDARIVEPYCHENSLNFVVEHTEQPPVMVGPIMLSPPAEEDDE